jgi:hypothetical protein
MINRKRRRSNENHSGKKYKNTNAKKEDKKEVRDGQVKGVYGRPLRSSSLGSRMAGFQYLNLAGAIR